MSRALLNGAAAVAIVAAVGGVYVGVLALRGAGPMAMWDTAAAKSAGTAIYYQDPDGKPFYSLTPRKTPDGRDYRAVPAEADVSFDSEASEAPSPTAAASERKVKYYRNPMGLPDT